MECYQSSLASLETCMMTPHVTTLVSTKDHIFDCNWLDHEENNARKQDWNPVDLHLTPGRPWCCRWHHLTSYPTNNIIRSCCTMQQKQKRLAVNKHKKTGVIINRINKQNAPIQWNGENIRKTNEFTYLGSIVSNNGGADDDVKSRINNLRQFMHSTPSAKFGIQKHFLHQYQNKNL